MSERHSGGGPRAGAGARRGSRPGPGAGGAAAARRPARRAARAGPRGPDGVVRTRGRGRGHHQPQDRRLPRGLPLLFAVRTFRLTGAQRLARRSEPGGGRQADRQVRRDRVLHRRRRARTRRAAAGPGRRGHRGDPQRGRHPDRLLTGHADPGAGRAALGDGRASLQPQPGDRPLVLHQRGDHPHLGGALGDAVDGPRGGHGGVLRRHPRHGRNPGAASGIRREPGRARIRTRCR